ncbi:MAG: AAA family ATPase [Sedimentisphaeraceae bacterium JB056]
MTTAVQKQQVRKRTPNELEVLIRSRYPLLYVVSWEEHRVVSQVTRIASRLNKRVFEWSVTTGLVPAGTSIQTRKNDKDHSQDPLVALDSVIEDVEPALYIFKDFHPFLKCENMAIVRRLREVAASLKNTYKTIVIVSPMFQIPDELEKDITVVDFSLPGKQEFTALLDGIVQEVRDNPKLDVRMANQTRENIIHAMLGLTLNEAENVLAKTLVYNRKFDENSLEVINREKKQIIRKSGLLQFYDSKERFETVGGLDMLKDWLFKRGKAFSEDARAFGLPAPKGVLLLGVQGCGKSLVAKTVSNIWHLPLLRFDIGQVFGSLVGSSEDNMRRAIKVAESIAPAIFWVDEIDKAFKDSKSTGGSDGGTSARVFGTFLTWLSEKTSPVFVVATANNISALPPELLRKGRFDEIFFVDLPSVNERKKIFEIHLSKRNINTENLDLDALAENSEGFSGAEIEEAIISAMFDVFYDKSDFTTEHFLAGLRQAVPLSRTMSEDIDKLRKWADSRARQATSPQLSAPADTGK